MGILLNLLIIQFIIVFIADISGFIDDGIEPLLGKIFKIKQFKLKTKPFKCSLCLCTWIGLIYILITGNFTIPMIGYVLLMAFLTPVTYNLLIGFRDVLIKLTKVFDI